MREGECHHGMCVLTFHRIVEDCQEDHDITWRSLRHLLEIIIAGGDAVDSRLASSAALRSRSLALTFDDATEAHWRVGEELANRGISAIFFVPAGEVGQPGRLSARMVRDLHSWGHIIGSHGFMHTLLAEGMSFAEIRRELGDSRAFLEDHTGGRVSYFAPPGGAGCGLVSRRGEQFGYEASRSMRWGIYGALRDRWDIPCVPVTEFTLARGWVTQALAAHRIPLAMRSAFVIKSLMPMRMRCSVRKMLHQTLRVQ